MADKLFSALSLCKKAGGLTTGFDAVAEALANKSAKLLAFSADISPKTKKRAQQLAPAEIPVILLPYTQADIAAITRKPVGVLAVTNQDLAALVQKASAAAKEEPV